MKNALLALTLFAFVGTASAHGDKDPKKGKKETCTAEMQAKCTKSMAGGCCMKSATRTAAVKAKPAVTVAAKSL